MYEAEIVEMTGLPPLAWVAKCAFGRLDVRHGSWVERGDGFAVEGVWSGEFAEGNLGSTETMFGTGVRLDDRGVTFVSSAATTDPLYYRVTNQWVVVSNSLPLLLASIGAELLPAFREYHLIDASIVDGIDAYRKHIPTTHGDVVRLLHRNLRVRAGVATEMDKDMPPPFRCYADYRDYLTRELQGILANARDRRRARPMQVFSTQSSGFDSTAVNAICSRFGLDKVFVNRTGKGPGSFADSSRSSHIADDGSPICDALGLPATPIERRTFELGIEMEDVYLSALAENGEYNLHDITKTIRQPTVVLTGQYGEVWRPPAIDKPGQLTAELRRHDLGGQGWSEVRLEAGFVHLPVPFLGARRRPEISAISESPEMTPWRSGTAYDKPIPARIAVECGVPRTLFGQAKKAAAVEFCPPVIPRDLGLRTEYFDFLGRHQLLSRSATKGFPMIHRINAAIWFAGPERHRFFYYAERALKRVLGNAYQLPLLWDRLRGSVYCFAVNRRKQELGRRLALSSPRSASDSAD